MAEVLEGLLTDVEFPKPKRTRKSFAEAPVVQDFLHRLEVKLAKGLKPLEAVAFIITDGDKKEWGKSAPRTLFLKAKDLVQQAGDEGRRLQVSLFKSLKGEVLQVAAPMEEGRPRQVEVEVPSSVEGTGGGAAVAKAKSQPAGKRKVR